MYVKLMVVLSIVGIVGSWISIKFFKSLLLDANIVRPNYKNDMIPICMGLVFIPMPIISTLITIFFFPEIMSTNFFVYLFAILAMVLVGLLDDLIGDTKVKGLKGHFKALFRGKLTTGGLKALTGGGVGLVLSAYVGVGILEVIIGTLIVALSTNLMNLLDLRPGRAIKAYLFLTLIIFAIGNNDIRIIILLLLPAVLAYFNTDLKAKAMMGDTGSNVLGVSIGLTAIMAMNFKLKLLYLVFLIIINIITEKYSLTRIIANNRALKFIDDLGRNNND